jgi:hypothetical protein
MKLFICLLFFLNHIFSFPQVGIGTTTPHASSVLDVNSTSAGFLPPRLTSAQRDAIVSPAIGLTIYNIEINCLEWWNGTIWFNGCGTTFLATIPANSLCIGKTISKLNLSHQKVLMKEGVNFLYLFQKTEKYCFKKSPMPVLL